MAPQETNKDDLFLAAVFKQIDGKLDYNQLAADMGLPSRAAAQGRWWRFNQKLLKSTGGVMVSKSASAASAKKYVPLLL